MHAHAPSEVTRQTQERRLAVLVIDDEPLIRWAVVETVSECGHTAIEAHDAVVALRAIMTASHDFDLIFLDFRLPDSNVTFLQAIRNAAPRSAVVVMTASATPDLVNAAYRLGVSCFLHKPFDIREVSHILSAVNKPRV